VIDWRCPRSFPRYAKCSRCCGTRLFLTTPEDGGCSSLSAFAWGARCLGIDSHPQTRSYASGRRYGQGHHCWKLRSRRLRRYRGCKPINGSVLILYMSSTLLTRYSGRPSCKLPNFPSNSSYPSFGCSPSSSHSHPSSSFPRHPCSLGSSHITRQGTSQSNGVRPCRSLLCRLWRVCCTEGTYRISSHDIRTLYWT